MNNTKIVLIDLTQNGQVAHIWATRSATPFTVNETAQKTASELFGSMSGSLKVVEISDAEEILSVEPYVYVSTVNRRYVDVGRFDRQDIPHYCAIKALPLKIEAKLKEIASSSASPKKMSSFKKDLAAA